MGKVPGIYRCKGCGCCDLDPVPETLTGSYSAPSECCLDGYSGTLEGDGSKQFWQEGLGYGPCPTGSISVWCEEEDGAYATLKYGMERLIDDYQALKAKEEEES